MRLKRIIIWATIVAISIFVLGLGFFRFIVLPEQTRVSCDKLARNAVSETTKATTRNEAISEREEIYNYYYNSCFRQAGLKPEIR